MEKHLTNNKDLVIQELLNASEIKLNQKRREVIAFLAFRWV